MLDGPYSATKHLAIFFAWIGVVTGTITVLSGDPNPFLGTIVATLILVPAIAFVDWEMKR